MKLEKLQFTPLTSCVGIQYQLEHSTPGRDGTTLSVPVTVNIGPSGHVDVIAGLITAQGDSVETALDKLQSYLERLAEALRERRAHQTKAPFVNIIIPVG